MLPLVKFHKVWSTGNKDFTLISSSLFFREINLTSFYPAGKDIFAKIENISVQTLLFM